MAKQVLLRYHFTVVEQANGYFTVHASDHGTEGFRGSTTAYPNLSWAETSDLLAALLDQWSATHMEHQQTVVGVPWVQLSLI